MTASEIWRDPEIRLEMSYPFIDLYLIDLYLFIYLIDLSP